MPRLKPETVQQKIDTIDAQIKELNQAINQLKALKQKPLQNRYLSQCPAGGSAFAGKEDKQSENSYWVLYQSNPRKRIRNINKRDVVTVKAQVEAGKQLTKLSKRLDKLVKNKASWQQKL
ncbi:MAG: hypothetical protein AB8B99_14255 [Phormidesmis sp.]